MSADKAAQQKSGMYSEAVTTDVYNYKVVQQFAVMTVVWGIVGMGVGVYYCRTYDLASA